MYSFSELRQPRLKISAKKTQFVILGIGTSLPETVERIDAVSDADVRRFAEQMASQARTMESEISQLQQSVDEIEDKGRSMHNVIGVINEIAEQTNVLGVVLNADKNVHS